MPNAIRRRLQRFDGAADTPPYVTALNIAQFKHAGGSSALPQ